MSKVLFTFKDDTYTFKELFGFHVSKKNIYQEGEVVNVSTGESFDISEIKDIKSKYYDLLNEVTETIGNEHDRRIKWALNKKEEEDRIKYLKSLYDSRSIKIDEMAEYINLKKKHDSDFIKNRSVFGLSYDNFITLNIGEMIPKTVKYIEKGRFYDMLYYLSYDNKLKHTPRKNGRVIKKEELIEFLEFKDYSAYRKFITSLIKNNLIREIPTTNRTKVIIINPIYANRNIRIDYTTFLTFKDDIKKFLTEEEIYYIEMLGNKDDLVGAYEVD